jgi:hypothetical protein
MEERLIANIRNGIRAIKLGLKTPKEASIGTQFTRLKELNKPMYDELLNDYTAVVNEYKTKNPK